MTNPSSAPDRKAAQFSMSSNVYWLLLLLLPLGWWIGKGGGDFVRRTTLAAVAVVIFVLAIMIGWFSKIHASSDKSDDSESLDSRRFSLPANVYWLMLFLLSIGWWIVASNKDPMRSVLLAAVSLAAFMVGTMAGFVFSSFGEEMATFGKIRDWVIAGITGATLAELAEQGGVVRRLLLNFVASKGPGEFGLVISMAIVYFSLGFFFMFLQRELLLNLLLAKSRVERGKLDGTAQAGIAVQKLLSKLPPSLLTGIDDLSDAVEPEEARELRSLLDSDDVKTFLHQAEEAVQTGNALDWDSVSKAAYVYYYKIYCVPASEKTTIIQKALQWIKRSLVLNPLHVDLTMKYADALVVDEEYEAAASVLEAMSTREDAPAYVKQWLGYTLLWIPRRLKDAIEWSESYLREFPDSADSLFNIACAYAQLYCAELRSSKKGADSSSENRRQALAYLERGLDADPDYVEDVRGKYSQKGEDFECMAQDEDFRKLVGSDQEADKGIPEGDATAQKKM